MPSVTPLADICIPMGDEPAYSNGTLKVVTIGAGFSGLVLAHKIQHEFPELQEFLDHTIFELQDDIGGTWKVNTYPGVQCDVPAHTYAFPFDPNPAWSKFYADGDEILDYMKKTCDKWDLGRNIQFNTRVMASEWIEEDGKWKITVENNDNNGMNTLTSWSLPKVFSGTPVTKLTAENMQVDSSSRWKWPKIPGIHDFKGHKVHSADWDHSFDYSNKRIGIIVNGSSGIQILPQMAKLPGVDITAFQRNPTWITQSLGTILGAAQGEAHNKLEEESIKMAEVDEDSDQVGGNFNPAYTPSDQRRFAEKEKHKAYRKMLQGGMNKGFRLFRKDSIPNMTSIEVNIAEMRTRFNCDPELCRKLIPEWPLGCRRLTPGEGYLEAFLLPNVHLTQAHITKIMETGIQTTEALVDLDVIICATSFDVSNIPHFPVTGRYGVPLAEKWKDEPESYLSLACPDFPNYFIFTGPNATVGYGTLIQSMSWCANYMIKWFRMIASEDIKYVVPRQSATDEFVRYGDEIHKTLTWTGPCTSWYKNHRRVTATFPGSALLFYRMIQDLRPEDFEIIYRSKNRFRFMGNGFTEYELNDNNDLAFYVDR